MNLKKHTSTFLIIFLASFFLTACGKQEDKDFINLNKDKTMNDKKIVDNNKNLADSIKPNSDVKSDTNSVGTNPVNNNSVAPESNQAINSNIVVITTKYGDIVVKLYTEKIPNFSQNFIKKANSEYYDGLTFHRVEPGFVAQGGDPLGNGTGGGSIAAEIDQTPFVRGSVGVARGPDIKINNDSQFFICLTTEGCSQLTGQYTNFGEVISGMEFVDKIIVGDKIIKIKNK
jgi:peptidylprolyl isomerase